MVGVYLGVVQLLFALCWTIYVLYLPQLAAQAGIAAGVVVWLLVLDQAIFVLADFAMGVASDRMARVVGRVGHAVLAITLLSCTAFLALPFVAPGGSPALFLCVTVLWSISSSALRAPPLALIGRHAARPRQPMLVGLSLMGLGVAGAIAPYLGLRLRGIDPRWPFALASGALALATLGIVAAERALARRGGVQPGYGAPVSLLNPRPLVAFVASAVLAALAFQVHASLNAAPLYLRYVTSPQLPGLLPVFWIGFNLAMLPAGAAARRLGGLRTMGASALLAGTAAWLAPQTSALVLLAVAQFATGAAWAGVLMGGFSATLELGHTGREGRFSGALSSVLAFAALLRLLVVTAGWQKDETWRPMLQALPAAAWWAGGLIVLLVVAGRGRDQRQTRSRA